MGQRFTQLHLNFPTQNKEHNIDLWLNIDGIALFNHARMITTSHNIEEVGWILTRKKKTLAMLAQLTKKGDFQLDIMHDFKEFYTIVFLSTTKPSSTASSMLLVHLFDHKSDSWKFQTVKLRLTFCCSVHRLLFLFIYHLKIPNQHDLVEGFVTVADYAL